MSDTDLGTNIGCIENPKLGARHNHGALSHSKVPIYPSTTPIDEILTYGYVKSWDQGFSTYKPSD
jgi:hypothetical protein